MHQFGWNFVHKKCRTHRQTDRHTDTQTNCSKNIIPPRFRGGVIRSRASRHVSIKSFLLFWDYRISIKSASYGELTIWITACLCLICFSWPSYKTSWQHLLTFYWKLESTNQRRSVPRCKNTKCKHLWFENLQLEICSNVSTLKCKGSQLFYIVSRLWRFIE